MSTLFIYREREKHAEGEGEMKGESKSEGRDEAKDEKKESSKAAVEVRAAVACHTRFAISAGQAPRCRKGRRSRTKGGREKEKGLLSIVLLSLLIKRRVLDVHWRPGAASTRTCRSERWSTRSPT